MPNLRSSVLWAHLLAGAACLTAQNSGCLIQSKQAGPVRVGMTIDSARKALSEATLKLSKDADHMTILTVARGGERTMDLYPDADEPRTERAAIIVIRVYDPQCATADGVHPGAPLAEVEKRYGKLIRLERTEVESREYAEFEKLPSWLDVQAGHGEAGLYAKGKRCAYRYAPGAKVESLWVSHPRTSTRFFLNDSECDVPAQ
jgi:hypothetical protein